MNEEQEKMSRYYPLLVISLCAFFLFYKYILQIYPSIITDQLMREFHLTAAGLGNLAAMFYYAYVIMQLFAGIILDKSSTRVMTSIAIFSCAFGVFLFANANHLWVAWLARALMGMGVAFSTITYMQLAAAWFHPSRYAFISGLLATAAMAGAVFGQAPLAFAVNAWGWRHSLLGLSIAGLILAILFLFCVRDAPHMSSVRVNKPHITFQDVYRVFKNRENWLLSLYAGLAFTPIAVFGGLWGNPFLQTAYHIDKTQSSFMISLLFIGLGLGSPFFGFLSDTLNERRNLMFICTLLACGTLCLVLYCNFLPLFIVSILLFLFGFLLGVFMITFAIAREINSALIIATVVAMINSCDAILTAFTEPAIGKLLDLTWHGEILNGVRYFSLKSYYIALSILPLYLFVAALLLLMVKFKKSS